MFVDAAVDKTEKLGTKKRCMHIHLVSNFRRYLSSPMALVCLTKNIHLCQ